MAKSIYDMYQDTTSSSAGPNQASYMPRYKPGSPSYDAARDSERNERVSEGDYWSRDVLPAMGQAMMGEHDFRAQSPGVDSEAIQMDRAAGYDTRGQQQAYADYLRDVAMGRAGPSVAEQQMRAGLQQAQRSAASQAAGSRGANVGLARYQQADTYANLASQSNRDSAMLRAQEQMSREATYAQALRDQRAQDLQTQGMSLEQAVAQANSEMQAQGYNTQIAEGIATRRQEGAGGIMSGIGAAAGALAMFSDVRVKQDIERADPLSEPSFAERLAEHFQRNRQADAQMAQAQQMSAQQSMIRPLPTATPTYQAPPPQQSGGGGGGGDILGMIGGIAGGFSDERLKTDIQRNREDLAPVEPYRFRYKPEFALRAREDTSARHGIMAQDLERSPLFRESVIDTPMGKALDGKRLLQADTAAIGGIDKRLRALEGDGYRSARR